MLSRAWLFATPWTVTYLAPQSMEIFQASLLQREVEIWIQLRNIFNQTMWEVNDLMVSSQMSQTEQVDLISPLLPLNDMFF